MTQVNLSELDFDNIRQSLVNYLKTQDTVKDFNFEGSAINFLLDLLAYNTLYYAHFANMISGEAFLDSAQLERSIVSLVKPLGYVLPTRISSKARIKLENVSTVTIIEPFTVNVIGTTPEGLQYNFWNIEQIPVTNNSTNYFTAYEGTLNTLTYGGNGFDYPDQKILIPDLTMDINTIRISVKRTTDDDYKYWTLVDTYSGQFIEPTNNLYALERTSGGFVVKFRTTAAVTTNLVAGDLVKIQYLASNGANGNRSGSFRSSITPSGSIVRTLQPSQGGLNSPDLEEAKTVAPLIFAAQQRLVTKSDYKGYLAQLGYPNAYVWGGEDNSPPIYGRLLFSISGINTTDNSIIRDVVTKLKERSVVTVLPEYVNPISLRVNLTANISYNDSATVQPDVAVALIKQEILDKYPVGAYSTSLSLSDTREIVQQYEGFNLDSFSNVTLQYTVSPSTRIKTLNFKNRLRTPTQATQNGYSLVSSLFTSTSYSQSQVQIRDVPILFQNSENPPEIGKLKLYSVNQEGVVTLAINATVGDINYKTGVVTLSPNLSNSSFEILAAPYNTNQITAKDEVYLRPNITTQVQRV